MAFMEDNRAVSTIIGAIFVLAFLVIAISINQVQVVPAENAQIEATHNQEVQDDLLNARSAIIDASYPQRDGTVSVTLGTRYPARILGVNPGPAAGRLRTTANENLVVEDGSGSVRDVCVGDPNADTTRRLQYEPNYNEYSAPTTVYENTFLYNQQEAGGSLGEARLTGTALAFTSPDNAGTINLIALKNEYSAEGVRSVSVEFVSGETLRTESVTNATIELPTGVSTPRPNIWDDIVAEIDAKEGTNSGVEATIVGFTPGSSVTIQFDGQYDILCTPVGVGGEPPSGASSLVPPGSSGGSTTADDISYNGNLATGVFQKGSFEFQIKNDGSSAAEITKIRVETSGDFSVIDQYYRNGGNKNEVNIDTDTDGFADSGNPSGPASPSDSDTFAIGQTVSLDTNAVTNAGSTGTVQLGDFRDDSGNRIEFGTLQSASEANAELTVVLTFNDGSTKKFYFKGDTA